MWRQSQLRKDRSGLWYCKDEGSGLDFVTLSEGNAQGSADWANRKRQPREQGSFQDNGQPNPDGTESGGTYVPRLTRDDI